MELQMYSEELATVPPFRLSPKFLENYKTRKPPFGFNGLGELVYLRTYSRIKPDGTNERWWETVQRVVEGTYNMQRRWIAANGLHWDQRKAQRSAQEMYERIFTMKFLPPGRGLWAMGSPLTEEKGLWAALNNCFSGDTKLLTDKGAVCFADVVGETVQVLNSDWAFVPADVRQFGEQPIQEVVLKPRGLRTNHRLTYRVTPNHTWVLANGERTTALQVGDILPTRYLWHWDTDEMQEGIRHGLMFGDGTQHTYYPDRYMIRLCGKKADWVQTLESHPGYVSTTVVGGEPFITIRSDERLKELPVGKSPAYLAGFIHGWLATDGWQKPSGTSYCLDTQDGTAAEWVIEHAPLAGYIVTGHGTDDRPTNYGPRSASLHRVSLALAREASVEFVVESITSTGEVEPVYCVTEPITHSFTLAGGVLTGNCAFTSTANLKEDLADPFTFLMDASMLGIGVGFDTKGAGQITIQKPRVEFDENGVCKHWYVIPDTREGWVESIRLLLLSFFTGDIAYGFDFSQIRPAGEPIKGFGGVASGPEPLAQLHADIDRVLTPLIGQSITVTAIVDLMNLIGKCVVAGNVRRTAEIAFGAPDSIEFLDLKNYQINPHRADYGWTSNNSVFAELGMDYGPAAERIALNGEPGFAWLDNMRAFGRMGDPANWKDVRADGCNPCVEQTLESYELCCLVETFPGNHDSFEDYQRTLKFAYLYAKTVTLGRTPWARTNAVMLRNRRIGLSQSGIVQAIRKFGMDEYRRWCEEGYHTVQHYDKVYSEWLAIPRSVKTTSVKPSGSVSLLAGATPGMHYPEARTYIRRMRLGKHSDLIQPLLDAGYRIEPAIGSEDSTYVVEIPVKIEDDIRTAEEVSMWEQLALAAFLQRYWSDNQVSATVTFDPETEGPQIEHALNYFQYQLKGISFLPRKDYGAYPQMPYEAISEAEYEKRVAELGELNFELTHEKAEAERFCSNDTCTIG